MSESIPRSVKFAILVAALGYFVDAFDMLLFSVLRVQSLHDLGILEENMLETGKWLLNCQMWGMLLGGLIWGILGDKRGRLQVLFGSILLYSAATFLNAFVQNTEQYAWLRFLAGLGLAGELGGAITLVSELMPKEKRGLATTFVATIGVSGVVAAGLFGKLLPWRETYMVGGIMGFALLILRVSVHESGIFNSIKQSEGIRKGDVALLFGSLSRIVRYACCILLATPTWFVVGILMTFCSELGKAKGIPEPLVAADAVLWCYVGLTLGDLGSGVASQLLRSRRKAIIFFLVGEAICISAILALPLSHAWQFYALSVPTGFFVGYWVVFVTSAAEQFGTNLRATVTTTVPNFVRASVIPMTTSFAALKDNGFTVLESASIIGAVVMGIAIFAAWKLQESFQTDLNYLEH